VSAIIHDRLAAPTAGERSTVPLPREDVPILVNSYNRLGCLRQLLSWLARAGQRRIYVVDNASEYPPLLAYLQEVEALGVASVVRLNENMGHLAIWRHELLDRLGIDTEFVYTDPDVIPADTCPPDVVGLLQSVLADNPEIATAGLGLRLDDLPDSYPYKSAAIDWERQFWRAPAAPRLFLAQIDTTFALYRPGSGPALGRLAIRTGWPYVAAHCGWYLNEDELSDEDLFYRQSAERGTSNWSASELPQWLATAAREQASQYPRIVQVAPPGVVLPGYLPVPPAGEIPAPSGSMDGIYIADELARLVCDSRFGPDLRRVIKPRGCMVVHARRPHPSTVRAILRQAPEWMAGWRLRKAVVAAKAVQPASADLRWTDATVDALMLHLEPAREPDGESRPEIHFGNLDHWPGFVPARC
jgi:hypothetical protein